MTTIQNRGELENIVRMVVSEVFGDLRTMDLNEKLKSLSVRHAYF